jgi:ABC-type uncharacterized transport system ATPase subunit
MTAAVLMITHKFREVAGFADDVSVLRRALVASRRGGRPERRAAGRR